MRRSDANSSRDNESYSKQQYGCHEHEGTSKSRGARNSGDGRKSRNSAAAGKHISNNKDDSNNRA